MTRTDFSECLDLGQQGEQVLDSYFSKYYVIRPAFKGQQKKGIDRIFIHKKTEKEFFVEYKTDTLAGRTGNAFLELAKHLEPYRQGWVYTCQADFLVYYLPDRRTVYIVQPEWLRRSVDTWLAKYPLRTVNSRGRYQNYQTQGVLVPLAELAEIGQVICL